MVMKFLQAVKTNLTVKFIFQQQQLPTIRVEWVPYNMQPPLETLLSLQKKTHYMTLTLEKFSIEMRT